jgi:hypothetical protein
MANSALLTSATAPISTGKRRPIAAGSTSIWISVAGGTVQVDDACHGSASISVNRAPTASTTSESST